jgi:glucosylglycerate synthase
MADRELPAEIERRLAAVGDLDLLLVVLTYQHAATAGGVVRGLGKAVHTHFPEARFLVLHWDAGSTDGTLEAVAEAAGETPVLSLADRAAAPRAMTASHRVPGADLAFRLACRVARTTGARAVGLVGADLRSVPEAFVAGLLGPVWAGELDLVAPLFARHVLDGTVTSCLLYPLTRALYGGSVRHLVASELGLGRELVLRLEAAPGWGTAASRPLPLFLAATAAGLGVRLGERALGAREAEPGESRHDLGAIMSEVVGGAFALAEIQEETWRERGLAATPVLHGAPALAASEVSPASQARMVGAFRQGVRDLQPIWEQGLSATTLADLYALGDLAPDEFVFSAELWARVVFDVLLAYRFRVLHRDHLLRSLVPLYFGRLAALCREAARLPAVAQERLLERQAQAFERAKPDLVDRWR